MDPNTIRELIKLLRELEKTEFPEMHNYFHGLWSRRNLSALIDDLENEIAAYT